MVMQKLFRGKPSILIMMMLVTMTMMIIMMKYGVYEEFIEPIPLLSYRKL